MVVLILLLLLIVGVALVGALYSSFLAFYSTFGDTIEYNKAYYAAISGLERAELVLRYRSPGYEGSGGWINDLGYGNSVDHRPTSFGYFLTGENNGILRTITSRTNRIPKQDEGNVERMLMTGDSLQYNKLDYTNAENFTFELDNTSGNPYTTVTTNNHIKSGVTSFTGSIRLPALLRNTYGFGTLATEGSDSRNDIGQDQLPDDPMVEWSFRGIYDGAPFQVLPTVGVQYYGNKQILYAQDSRIMESRINNGNALSFGSNKNPFNISPDLPILTVISAKDDTLSGFSFLNLINHDNTTSLLFRIALLNLLYSQNKNIYPYLEYQFSFSHPISDRFYTIETRGKYGNYEVKMLIKKPTIKESILGSFTIIF